MKKLVKRCSICNCADGKVYKQHGLNPVSVNPDNFNDCDIKDIMIKEGCCFSCGFWRLKILNPLPNRIIIKGTHYVFEKDTDNYFKGSGGRAHYARLNNGTVLCSKNVWYQGEIPKQFRKDLPNNAVFITKEEYDREKGN